MKMNFNTKRTARTAITGVTFDFLPVMKFMRTYEIIPKRIPLEIEYENGIAMIQMNAGIDSEKSSNGIYLIGSSIRRPTMMRAGAVAAAGIERKRGEKKSATAKHIATANAVRPERPP